MARIRNATDLDLDLDRIAVVPATPRGPRFSVVLEGSGPWCWEQWDHAGTRRKEWPCAVCGGGALPRTWYCAACDRAGTDGRMTYPGLPVGRYLDPDWEAEATIYVSDERLKGGLGSRVQSRRTRREKGKAG